MRVLPAVGEYQIGSNRLLQILENHFYISTHKWHESVRKGLENRTSQTGLTRKPVCGMLGFFPSLSNSAKYHPVKDAVRIFFGQAQNGSAATYLNVVRVAAQAENL